MQILPWLVSLALLVVMGIGLATRGVRPRHHRKSDPLPTEWRLAPRLVFSTAERRIYRLLREALPNHVLLAKLPLVRFCQPTEPGEKGYWYNLLGTSHVSFAVCVPNGRVIAAIDIATAHPPPRRLLQIKQSVLDTCRVRYLRFSAERLPTVAELQILVPRSGSVEFGTAPLSSASNFDLDHARDALASAVATRRAERDTQWQESSCFLDSFFAPDSRVDGFSSSEFLPSMLPDHAPAGSQDHDVVGVVVDAPMPKLKPRSQSTAGSH